MRPPKFHLLLWGLLYSILASHHTTVVTAQRAVFNLGKRFQKKWNGDAKTAGEKFPHESSYCPPNDEQLWQSLAAHAAVTAVIIALLYVIPAPTDVEDEEKETNGDSLLCDSELSSSCGQSVFVLICWVLTGLLFASSAVAALH